MSVLPGFLSHLSNRIISREQWVAKMESRIVIKGGKKWEKEGYNKSWMDKGKKCYQIYLLCVIEALYSSDWKVFVFQYSRAKFLAF